MSTPGIGRLAGIQLKQVYPWSNLVPTTVLLACTPETKYPSGRQDIRSAAQSFFFGGFSPAWACNANRTFGPFGRVGGF